jgi:hypothetical protein
MLGWFGFVYVGLGCIRLGYVGLCWVVLGHVRLGCVGLREMKINERGSYVTMSPLA